MKTFTVEFLHNTKQYRVLQEFTTEIAFIGMPHQRPAKSFIYVNESHLRMELPLGFAFYTEAKLLDEFDEIPKEAKQIFEQNAHDDYVLYDGENWIKLPENPDFDKIELEYAKEALTYDLNSAKFFYSIDEIIDYMENGTGHKSVEAKELLCGHLEAYGYIEEILEE